MTAALSSAPLLASEHPRFSGLGVEFGAFAADTERLLLVGDWGPLFQLCAGKLELESGRLSIRGRAAGRAVLEGSVGLALADAPLPPSWSLHEVLRQSGQLLGLTAREAAQRASALARDAGLEARLQKPIGSLGAGERRAALLLAAALGDAPVLALEDPFRALEPSEQDFVARVLERLLPGRSALVAVREPPNAGAPLSWLRSADEVLMLGQRGLSARGRRAELQSTRSGYRVVVLRHVEALSALLTQGGYQVLDGRVAGGLGLTLADPSHQGTGPLVAAALRADAPIVELGPLWPSSAARRPTDDGG